MAEQYSAENPVLENSSQIHVEGNVSNATIYRYLGNNAQFTVPIVGYLQNIVACATVVTNILICATLLQKKMRTPTNMILLGMAVADMLTGVIPLPVNVYAFTLGNYKEYIPYSWCYVVKVFYDIVPVMFHTASIWLTVGLGVQRYVYVCKSIDARRVCSLKRVLICIGFIYGFAIIMHVPALLDSIYEERFLESKLNSSVLVSACEVISQPWADDSFYIAYYMTRVVAIHIIPCISLVILNALLVYTMRTAQARRRCLLLQNRKTEWKRIQDSNCTTMMLVTVVTVFLLVEIPLGILFTLLVVQNTTQVAFFQTSTQSAISVFVNFFIILSYPLNFVIYCSMSRQFRKAFVSLFFRGAYDSDNDQTQYLSMVQESNGNCKNGHPVTTATCLL